MFLLPAAVPERIERMCRPPTRYRRPALFVAISSLALAGRSLAQVDAGQAVQLAPAAVNLEPAPLQRESESHRTAMPDAGATADSRGEPAGFAGRAPSQEGMGTLPGFPYQQSDGSSTSEAGPAALSQDATQVPQPSQGPSDEGTPAFLHAAVNEVDIGDVFVLLRGNDVLFKVDDLEKPGLHVSGGARE